jgi:hypothetical protein
MPIRKAYILRLLDDYNNRLGSFFDIFRDFSGSIVTELSIFCDNLKDCDFLPQTADSPKDYLTSAKEAELLDLLFSDPAFFSPVRVYHDEYSNLQFEYNKQQVLCFNILVVMGNVQHQYFEDGVDITAKFINELRCIKLLNRSNFLSCAKNARDIGDLLFCLRKHKIIVDQNLLDLISENQQNVGKLCTVFSEIFDALGEIQTAANEKQQFFRKFFTKALQDSEYAATLSKIHFLLGNYSPLFNDGKNPLYLKTIYAIFQYLPEFIGIFGSDLAKYDCSILKPDLIIAYCALYRENLLTEKSKDLINKNLEFREAIITLEQRGLLNQHTARALVSFFSKDRVELLKCEPEIANISDLGEDIKKILDIPVICYLWGVKLLLQNPEANAELAMDCFRQIPCHSKCYEDSRLQLYLGSLRTEITSLTQRQAEQQWRLEFNRLSDNPLSDVRKSYRNEFRKIIGNERAAFVTLYGSRFFFKPEIPCTLPPAADRASAGFQ